MDNYQLRSKDSRQHAAKNLCFRKLKDEEAADVQRNLKELEILIWIGIAIGLMLLVGMFVGLPIFIFIFLKFLYSQGWKLSLGLPLGTMQVIYIIFIKALTIPLYNGIFFL
jgi:hypothetical protein